MLRHKIRRILRKIITPEWPGSPVAARHAVPSWVYSQDDNPAQPSTALLDVALRAADFARTVDLSEVSQRIAPPGIRYPEVWPGEHYKLLAAITKVVAPQIVIEIGTAEGLSALAFMKFLPSNARLVTFDIVAWNEYPGSVLSAPDFADGRLEQRLGDLADPTVFLQHSDLLGRADLLFVDAPKDGRFEPAFLDLLAGLICHKSLLVILDDIRVWNMLKVWREIRCPKLDMTSFGHWSGTGLVEWRCT